MIKSLLLPLLQLNRGISSVSVNNGASGGLNSGSSYYFTKTFGYGDYNFGNTTTFTATATDAAGNSTSSTLNVTITKSDTQTPVIQILQLVVMLLLQLVPHQKQLPIQSSN